MQTNDHTYHINNREIDWIYKRLNTPRLPWDTVEEKRKYIESYIIENATQRQKIEDLRNASASHLLPDAELKWINSKDIRLLRWLAHYCNNNLRFIMKLQNNENFISVFDDLDMPYEEKRTVLHKIKTAWSTLKLRDKKLEWLHQNNDLQIEWAWDYLTRNSKLISGLEAIWSNYIPINTEEMHLDILSIFDTWTGDPAELYDLQINMKQAWAQQKYRANLKNKEKKQSTYALSTKTKDNLEILARANNVKLNQMLEYIINEAHKKFKEGEPKKTSKKDDVL